jgi:hypothetical protein
MAQVEVLKQARWHSPEPEILAAGSAVLVASEVLPMFWSRGLNPVPACLFHQLTGQPCPFCGGTRCFVLMAHGDVGAALAMYPIGPLLFVGLIAAILYSAFALATGKRLRVHLDGGTRRVVIIAAAGVLALNWAAKLLVLGYGPSPF